VVTALFCQCASKQLVVETNRPEKPAWTDFQSGIAADSHGFTYVLRFATEDVQELSELKNRSKQEVIEVFKQQFLAQVPFDQVAVSFHSQVKERLSDHFDNSLGELIHLRDVYYEKRLNNQRSETVFYLQYDITRFDFDRFVMAFISSHRKYLAFQYNGFQIQSH
jgi:hypothetical protein